MDCRNLMIRVLLAWLIAACPGASFEPAAPEPRRIGLLLPPDEPERDAIRDAATLAAERWNTDPTNRARPRLELVIRGKPGQWGDDGDEAGRLVLDDAVTVLIAPPGGAASHLALQVAGRTRVPVVSLCPDDSVAGAGIPWMVRLVPSTSTEARGLLGAARRWWAWVPEGRAGREIRRDLERAARGEGAVIEAREWREGTELPVPPQEVGGVLVWLAPRPAGTVVARLRDLGWHGSIAGPSSLAGETFRRGAGRAAEGVRVAEWDPGPTAAAARQAFADAYRKRFGREVEPIAWFAADAVGLAGAWACRAGEHGSPDASASFLGATNGGLTGAWEFEPGGSRRGRSRVRALGP